MTDFSRLIEHAFPLKQTSLDSVHEKNVRHGHISTLHIWPARRPLAACRAALLATLLPDPGTPEARQKLCELIGGKVVKKIERKKMPDGQIIEREREATEGGILHWGREIENEETLNWFREEIKKAYGGKAPKVLDPFAGGGAIPLEAMRLGCETTAIDINPVAWFILKCTLEYPQKLAGKTFPLPDFILDNEEFMTDFYKAHSHLIGRTKATKKQLKEQEETLWKSHQADNTRAPKADLGWQVRAWGQWVLEQARKELAEYYPTYADFEAIDKANARLYEKQSMQLVPLKPDGNPDVDYLNRDFSKEYLADKRNPRWTAKPTVAYLWARTVTCKNCRALLPLLKTRWLCKKDNKRVLLTMEPNAEKTGVVFGVQTDVPNKGGNSAQKREHDKRVAAGTMTRSGASCPCCSSIMTMEDIRLEGLTGRLGEICTAVVIDGQKGKEYREPTSFENQRAAISQELIDDVFTHIPFGIPDEPLPSKEALGFRAPLYGFDKWAKLFTPRQLLALGTFMKSMKKVRVELETNNLHDYSEIIVAYLTCGFDRMLDFNSSALSWITSVEAIGHTFARYALPITWDYSESALINYVRGSWEMSLEAVLESFSTIQKATIDAILKPNLECKSALQVNYDGNFDLVLTDPPYYDAIPYSDLMDYFYVWLKRNIGDLTETMGNVFSLLQAPKWSKESNDGELIDDAARQDGNKVLSRIVYENGMARVFENCCQLLNTNGKLVVVFANKSPAAWESLVSAIIRSGFVVDGSWPIQTEQVARIRAQSSSALATSVWIVCKKRPTYAKPGWDNQVVEEMQLNIRTKLREFWDAGIRGPDFVWAATGPALEAFSKHPVVKKANDPDKLLTVTDFLSHVRKIVVDFVVGRVLSGDKAQDSDITDHLDEPTSYYLLHRHDFGMDEAPAGSCILYAVSCGISDKELADTWDLISFTKGKETSDVEEESDPDAETDEETSEDSGSKVKLKTWVQRKRKSLGYESPSGRPIPLIDRVHCLMHLWKAGDLVKVDEYLDNNALRRQELFKRFLQSLIELSPHSSEERSLLESLSNHIQAKGAKRDEKQTVLFDSKEETENE